MLSLIQQQPVARNRETGAAGNRFGEALRAACRPQGARVKGLCQQDAAPQKQKISRFDVLCRPILIGQHKLNLPSSQSDYENSARAVVGGHQHMLAVGQKTGPTIIGLIFIQDRHFRRSST